MKITKIAINFDDGTSLDYLNPKGLDLGDIIGSLGIDSLVDAESGTIRGILSTAIQTAVGILMARFGL